MHGTDIHNHRHIRLADLRKVRHFPEVVHAHFQHRHFRIFGHSQNRHGHTDVIVVIGRGLADTVLGFQHRHHHFLGSGLAHRTGDAYLLTAKQPLLFPCDLSQRDPGIVYNDAGEISYLAAAQSCRRALFHGHGDKIMTVPGTLQHDEQLVGLYDPGVVVGTQKFYIFILGLHIAAAPERSLLQCAFCHINSSILPDVPGLLPVHPDGASHRGSPDKSRDPFLPV